MKQHILKNVKVACCVGGFLLASSANAALIHWADWQSQTGNTVNGQFNTGTSTVDITYSNPQGIAFLQNGVSGNLTDYFNTFQDPANSPYTSSLVDNIPTAAELIALRYQGMQTLSFSESIANPVFSYVSLNGNGYAFDQDFDILSFGDGTDNLAGYWGSGTSTKEVVDIGGGVKEYRLIGTGEPHGTIRFTGAFDTVSWRSLSSENWNGFTVGVEGTAKDVFGVSVPEPSTFAIFALGLFGLTLRTLNRKSKK